MYSVIIVEDETLIRNGLKALIPWEKYGFIVAATVENGDQALKSMENQHFDVVITDVRMPRIDGLDLIRIMREKHIYSKVIILSGYRNFEYARTAIQYNVNNYLLKPICTEELIKSLLIISSSLDQESGQQNLKDGELVRQIKSIVALHYREKISMQEISKELHYNESYLGRLFLKQTGKTFREYLNLVRTKAAAELFAEGGRMVSDVALQVGYCDLNYFCKIFKKIYKISPSRYKNSLQTQTLRTCIQPEIKIK